MAIDVMARAKKPKPPKKEKPAKRWWGSKDKP